MARGCGDDGWPVVNHLDDGNQGSVSSCRRRVPIDEDGVRWWRSCGSVGSRWAPVDNDEIGRWTGFKKVSRGVAVRWLHVQYDGQAVASG
ncbi:hypothetical protein Dimus_020442 [Dionaea muscipula]